MANDFEHARGRAAVKLFREMLGVGVVYVGAVFASSMAIKHLDPPQWIAAMLALAPMLPAVFMVSVQLRYMRATDEFERRVQSESLLIAAAVVVFASLAYGQLEDLAGFPDVSLMFVFPAFCIVWSVASIVLQWRYK
ncbi:MAG: hypothetical protein NT015_18710 [Alphaproteobacteria bacterium]|nr:hypothetical protein [Alphaproteobacteria bacterium]